MTLVLCKTCTAMRSSDIKECFCGAIETKPVPPPKIDFPGVDDTQDGVRNVIR